MESTGKRVSAFLLELEEELEAKEREIEGLRNELAEQAAAIPAGLRELIQQQQAQIEHSRQILQSLELPKSIEPGTNGPTGMDGSSEDMRQLRAALDAEREAHNQQVSRFIEDLEASREAARAATAETAAERAEVQSLRAALESERDAHQRHIARLIGEIEDLRSAAAANEDAQAARQNEEAEAVRQELETEREAHRQAIEKVNADLKMARDSESALETALLEQRGALQRIEAKFSLYAAAVAKLAEPAEPRRPKLLQSSKQLSPRKAKVGGYSLG